MWVQFFRQVPLTESFDAKVEAFVKRLEGRTVDPLYDGTSTVPVWWPEYSKDEIPLVNALNDMTELESKDIRNPFNWFQSQLGGRGLTKTTMRMLYPLWKSEKEGGTNVQSEDNKREFLVTFVQTVGIAS